jgi:hypothetical protein
LAAKAILTVVMALVMVGSGLLLAPEGRAAGVPVGWRYSAIDPSKGVGQYPSMAINKLGRANVAYYNINNQTLKYAKWNGTAWQIQTVDRSVKSGLFTAIALDNESRARIAYAKSVNGSKNRLMYAEWNGRSWNISSVDAKGNVSDISIALNGSFAPYIAYYDALSRCLKLARGTGTGWNVSVVDRDGNVGKKTSIKLDGADRPLISYYDQTQGHLKFARWNGTAWEISVVDAGKGAGKGTSLTLDGEGVPHIAYLDSGVNRLKYASLTEGGWVNETVDAQGKVGDSPSLVIDRRDRPHISYQRMDSPHLMYATWNGTAWLNETVDVASASGWGSAIGINLTDDPRIAYFSSVGSARLKYAEAVLNRPPGAPARPEGPVAVLPGAVATYATCATDAEGDWQSMLFDWGDGNVTSTSMVPARTPVAASHAWAACGVYPVKARAVEAEGFAGPWGPVLKVTVDTPPGTPARPDGPTVGVLGERCQFTVSATDADGDRVRFAFDWGEGDKGGTGPNGTDLVMPGAVVSLFHVFHAVGQYTVRAKAFDSRGGASVWSAPLVVRISEIDTPDAPSGPALALVGEECTFAATASVPGGGQVKYVFGWDVDAAPSDAPGRVPGRTETGYVPSGTAVTGRHAWTTFGRHSVAVMVVDAAGTVSRWSPAASVLVHTLPDTPPACSGPGGPVSGATCTFSASTSDPDGDMVKYVFDWGEQGSNGTPPGPTETGFFLPGATATLSHAWSRPGTYHVRVMAVDLNGGRSNWSVPMDVRVGSGVEPSTPTPTPQPSGDLASAVTIAVVVAVVATAVVTVAIVTAVGRRRHPPAA